MLFGFGFNGGTLIILTPLNLNFISGLFVDVCSGIDTPLEFLFSSFLVVVVNVTGNMFVLTVVAVLFVVSPLVGSLSTGLGWEVVVEVVDGLLKIVNGLTFGLVNVGRDMGVTGVSCGFGLAV